MGAQLVTALTTGLRMDRDEFIRRWEEIPDLKRAELVDGVVRVPSPVSREHSVRHADVIFWLKSYASRARGLVVADNPTLLLLDDSPQPDAAMWLSRESGGGVDDSGTYPSGPPELIVEVCVTSAAEDLGPKLALYERAGVREYITIETQPRRITWRSLEEGSYRPIPLQSRVFPGLRLDAGAFWAGDSPRLTRDFR